MRQSRQEARPDPVGSLGEVTQVGSYANGVTYHPTGAIAGFNYGNGLTHSQSLNARQLPLSRQDAGVMNDSYTYDANGNIASITDNQQSISTRNLGYDNLDRLTTASAPNMWGTGTYTYDGLDNLKVSTIGTTTITRNYNSTSNLLSSINQVGGATPGTTNISYDTQGNVSLRGSQGYAFDLGNRLVSATNKASYLYDGLGRRTRVTQADGTIKLQLYSQAGQLLYGVQSNGPNTASITKYIYLGTREVAEVKTLTSNGTTTTQYVHTDALGSPVAHTDPSANIVDRSRYEPYGANAAFGGGVAPNGIGFTGHVNDIDTGLVYMQQRYYDPVAGRFLSLDPKLTDVNSGGGFNRYVYANSNPYRYTDPDGRDACEGQSARICIRSDTYNERTSNNQTTVASEAVAKIMVTEKSSVAVTSGDKEKIGFVVKDGSGFKVVVAVAETKSTATTDSAAAPKPADAVAVIHGHIDGQSAGVQSPADASPLKQNLPNGVVTLGRVGVTEIVNGRLQFRMLEGKMTSRESRDQQQNLDSQQPQFQKE
jgi:RHS repeat-associated protein